MTKLIRLPNGRWVRPDLVAFIGGPTFTTNQGQGSFNIRIEVIDASAPLLFHFESESEAAKFRDDCAALVNGTAAKKPFTKVTDLPRSETLKETNDRLIREGKVDAR